MPSSYPIDYSHCEKNDVRCVFEAVDEIPWDAIDPGDLYKELEGYQPVSVIELYDLGRLKVKSINPLLLPFIAGATGISWYNLGDIHHATILYPPYLPFSNAILAHEAEHVKGFKGNLLDGGWFNGPLPMQVKIMKEENVDHWWETSVYKNEDPTYHWDKWRKQSETDN